MAQRKPKPPLPTLEEIASFYSGGNMKGKVTFDWTNTNGTTGMPGSGNIRLNPSLQKSWNMLRKYGPRSQQGMVYGSQILSTLIHEALHNKIQEGFDNTNEIQMTDMGVRLIPDAMHRFFGIDLSGPWGKKYTAMVLKQLAPIKPGG